MSKNELHEKHKDLFEEDKDMEEYEKLPIARAIMMVVLAAIVGGLLYYFI